MQSLITVVNRGDVKRVMAREVTILCARAFICINKCYKKRGLHLCVSGRGANYGVLLEYPLCFVRVSFVFC